MNGITPGKIRYVRLRCTYLLICLTTLVVTSTSGCYAPLRSPAISASELPESFRTPVRTSGAPLNYASLTLEPPSDYIIGAHDLLDVTVPGLYERAETVPMRVQVMTNGEIHLPLAGSVNVGGLNLVQIQEKLTEIYDGGFLKQSRVIVVLAQKSSVRILVLGQVESPGLHVLPKYQNDVGSALAAAEGFGEYAADMIEIHRRRESSNGGPLKLLPPIFDGAAESTVACDCNWDGGEMTNIQRIPLRGPGAQNIRPEDITLRDGDVVVVPSRRHEVFYVVGQLNRTNTVRFTVGDRDRELGAGFVLPRDREIDVVTAVAMAGYIDPIDSPTTVTVHRACPGRPPTLIRVDLIKARYDPRENVLVQPGDIIYLNPDGQWWFRRTFDRVLPELITSPYREAMGRWINPRRN